MVLIFGLETTNPKHTLETRFIFILNDVFGPDDIRVYSGVLDTIPILRVLVIKNAF